MQVKKGNTVKIEYEGSLEDGTVFDSSEKHGKLLEFEAGSGKVIPGFDKAVIGMKKDEKKEIIIKPEEAYGMPDEKWIQKVPRDKIPKDQEPQVGMMIAIGLPNGQQMPAVIKEVTDKEVTLDINHPLAGKTLKFKIKLIDFE